MLKKLSESPSVAGFLELIQKEPSILIEALWDAPKAALALLAQKATSKNILLLSGSSADKLLDNFSFFSDTEVLDFLPWETLPGEEIPPSADITGKRLEILYALESNKGPHIVHAPLQAVLQKTISPSTLKKLCHKWKKGDSLSFSELPSLLTSLGYKQSRVAADKGEFAVRGGIIDLFPISASEPYRLDFFGDTLEEIRTYDPIGQKSIKKVDSLFLCPASEWDLLKSEKHLSHLLDYLGDNTIVIFNDLLAIEDHYVSIKELPGSKTPFFSTLEEELKKLRQHQHLLWSHTHVEELSDVQMEKKTGRAFYSGKTPLQELKFQFMHSALKTKRWLHPFIEISDFFCSAENKEAATADEILHNISRYAKSSLELHFVSSSEAEELKLKHRLSSERIAIPEKTTFERGYLTSGFAFHDIHRVYLPVTELTHRYKTRRQKWRNTYHTPASEFHELSPGDIVVHFHNGIGKFLGIEKKKNHIGEQTEFMVIEYADESKLFVPIAQSHLVSRYIGAKEEMPVLSALGSPKWQKTCVQAQKAIIGYAKELLDRAAQREIQGGFSYPNDSNDVHLFEEEFPFVETEDQLHAISDVKNDMTSHKAMDRLICGDVGYGKTEVAMRAAFKAVVDGKKQVALLVPTTVLAMQHYENFKERMSNFAVNVGVISRFLPAKQIKETLKKVADGTIDVVIGTHRIISGDVVFKDLGLIIIDEEQRFGVRAKECLKKAKVGVDCLTLSATPIPRTLYMSLIGAREISVINTPPQDRLPIKSILSDRDPSVIQNALLRELSRDGQAFFIHNRVESIFQVKEELQKLLPQARIVVGHGQMSADELDTVFHSFKTGNADILVATTIVENGIDIPNANTILIDRADQYGLADLYQLRGRVGRWNRPAYAYFLTHTHQRLPEIARKRLYAILESSGHGGGMKIAMRDLEIRGAGDILGLQQSGQVSAIGFHLYCKLLKKTIDAIRKKQPIHFIETKIECSFDAKLPDEYINESSLRMEIYHKLGEASSFEEVDTILDEMKDRFGPLPPAVLWLYHLTRIRIFASQHYITLLKFDKLTMTAEKHRGKEPVRKTFPLSQMKKPAELEKQVIENIQKL